MLLIAPLFFALALFCVFGTTQIREVYAERNRRGIGPFGAMLAKGDFTRFYFPVWGRMFIWVLAAGNSAICVRAFLK